MQKEYWEVKDGWSDNVYSFSKYESALSYATSAEKRFVAYKTWNTATWDQGIPMDTKDSVNAKNGNYIITINPTTITVPINGSTKRLRSTE